MDVREIISKRISDLRIQHDVSQELLAKELGISRTTLSKWENGQSEPSSSDIHNLGKYFNVDYNYFFGNDVIQPQKIVVLDTSIILNRPLLLPVLLKHYDIVSVPNIVIQELNFQKDKGKSDVKQKAWLAMTTLEKCKSDEKIRFDSASGNGINDEKIMGVARRYALNSVNHHVDMLSNDTYFSLQNAQINLPNLKAIRVSDIESELFRNPDFDEYQTSIFISNVRGKNLTSVKEMDLSNVDVNRLDSISGFPALTLAVRNNDEKMLKHLLTIPSIDLNRRDEYKYCFTPLMHACQMKNLSFLKLLIESGADVNASSRGKNTGNTPLMVCSWGHFNEGIKLFLQNNVSLNQQDNNGFTALHKAVIKGNYFGASLLIDKIDHTIQDFQNKTAADYVSKDTNNYSDFCHLFSNKVSQ